MFFYASFPNINNETFKCFSNRKRIRHSAIYINPFTKFYVNILIKNFHYLFFCFILIINSKV